MFVCTGLHHRDTCDVEQLGSIAGLRRRKNKHVGYTVYEAKTNAAILEGNEVAFVRVLKRVTGEDKVQVQWLWLWQLWTILGLSITPEWIGELLTNHAKREARSLALKDEASKLREMAEERARIIANLKRTEVSVVGGSLYVSGGKGGDRGIVAVPAWCAGMKVQYGPLPRDVLCVSVDLELPASGVDHIMEAGAVAVKCTEVVADDGSTKTQFDVLESTFCELSRTLYVNPLVVGNAHLNAGTLMAAQPEKELVEKLVRWLDGLHKEHELPIVLLAHNGFATEAKHFARAFARAGIDIVAAMDGVGCIGMIDTQYICKAIQWSHVPGPGDDRIRPDTSQSLLKAAVDGTTVFRKAKVKVPETSPCVDELEEGVKMPVGLMAPEQVHKDKVGLMAVYVKLTGEEFPDAHQALVDAQALLTVVTHKTQYLWTLMTSQPTVLGWGALKAHADSLAKVVADAQKGWEMNCPDYPVCDHGRMKVPKKPTAAATTVTFTCVAGVAACMQKVLPAREGWVAPPVPEATAKNGVSGACTCAGQCATRQCPCVSESSACTPACHSKNKVCKNDAAKLAEKAVGKTGGKGQKRGRADAPANGGAGAGV